MALYPSHPSRTLAVQPSQQEASTAGLRLAPGYSVLQRRHVPSGDPWRRWHVSRHTSPGGTQSSHSTGGGGRPISWSLLHKLTPRCGGSQLRGSHTPTVRYWITTLVTKPYSCSRLQQLEQGNHLGAQAMAQPEWQCLQAGCHILDQGSPTRQVDLSEISRETSLRSHPPSWRGNDKEGAGSQGTHLLLTQRGKLLERSLEGIDIPPSPLMGFYCLWEGLPEGVLPGLHIDIFPPTTNEIQINS